MLFPGRKFPFWYTQNKFSSFSKVKSKKKKKKKKRSSPLFLTFSCFHSQFSTFSSQFSPLFPFFLASFFPIRQQKFPGQKSLGGHSAPLPPACYATAFDVTFHANLGDTIDEFGFFEVQYVKKKRRKKKVFVTYFETHTLYV